MKGLATFPAEHAAVKGSLPIPAKGVIQCGMIHQRSPLFLISLLAMTLAAQRAESSPTWEGAWQSTDSSQNRLLLVIDGFWSYTVFDLEQPRFYTTFGGTYQAQGNGHATAVLQFDSAQAENVGDTLSLQVEQSGDSLRTRNGEGQWEHWVRIAESTTAITGVWRITGRKRGDEISEMPLRPRRTLKVLTGTRFQWIAMNIETGEFSGSGGGTYTFEDGAYVENIEFFSRDDSRVGAELEFKGEVKDGHWHHSGLSSRGDPIYEIWSRFDANSH